MPSLSHQRTRDNLIALFVFACVFVVLFLIKPTITHSPKGIALPSSKSFTLPSSGPVKLYDVVPEGAKELGHVNVETHTTVENASIEEKTKAEAIALTESLGGNGLVIQAAGYELPGKTTPRALAKYLIYGVAIQVPSTHKN